MHLLKVRRIKVVVLSPPCTMFSQIMRINSKKMKPEDLKCRWNEAMTFIHFTVQVLEYILSIGGFFVFEHPAGASSWQLPIILELQKRRGMKDQVPPMSLWASVTYYQATHSKIHTFFCFNQFHEGRPTI